MQLLMIVCVMLAIGFNFFFNAPPTAEIYTLSLHDALPISSPWSGQRVGEAQCLAAPCRGHGRSRRKAGKRRRRCGRDRKSTRLNSSHVSISYAVFCLKKKKKKKQLWNVAQRITQRNASL